MWSVIKCVDGIKKVVAEVYSSLLHHRHAVVVLVLLIEVLCTSQRTKTASWRWWWWWCWRCGGSELVIVVMVVVVLEFFGSRYQSLVRLPNWPERAGWGVWLVDGWWSLVAEEERTRAFCWRSSCAGGSSGREEKLARVTTLGDAAARITVLIPFSHNDAQSALL